jgi:hypothetical protein
LDQYSQRTSAESQGIRSKFAGLPQAADEDDFTAKQGHVPLDNALRHLPEARSEA